MSSNHVDFTGLRKWFSDKDIRIYFGSRTQDEINYAITFFGKLKADDVQKMSNHMAQVAGQRHAGERKTR